MVRGIVGKDEAGKVVSILNPIENIEQDCFTKENIVLFVGRLDFQKRVDRLLRIWSLVEKNINDWKLVIVGDGEYRMRYQNYAKSLNLKNVCFVGYKRGADYMKHSQIITVQSSHEGYPMVLIEAMKNRNVPVVFNSFEAAEDIIDDGKNGILVQPFNENFFAAAILKLIENASLLKRMQQAATLSVNRFFVTEVASKWEKLLNSK